MAIALLCGLNHSLKYSLAPVIVIGDIDDHEARPGSWQLAVAEFLHFNPERTFVTTFSHGKSKSSTAKITTRIQGTGEWGFFIEMSLDGDDGVLMVRGK